MTVSGELHQGSRSSARSEEWAVNFAKLRQLEFKAEHYGGRDSNSATLQ
jgi:hypothetical protein